MRSSTTPYIYIYILFKVGAIAAGNTAIIKVGHFFSIMSTEERIRICTSIYYRIVIQQLNVHIAHLFAFSLLKYRPILQLPLLHCFQTTLTPDATVL
jgi:hypothetical protein